MTRNTGAAVLLFVVCGLGTLRAQCPNVSPAYADLESWVHGANNGLSVQVTLVNPAASDGTHFFTSWGKSCLEQGVGGYGQCRLTTNPQVYVLYSDRTNLSTAPENTPAHTMHNANQPFSIKAYDVQVTSLDMVNNTITNKSITWNYEVVYTNVKRIGGVVYGDKNGNLIILNLSKVHYPSNMRTCGDW